MSEATKDRASLLAASSQTPGRMLHDLSAHHDTNITGDGQPLHRPYQTLEGKVAERKRRTMPRQ